MQTHTQRHAPLAAGAEIARVVLVTVREIYWNYIYKAMYMYALLCIIILSLVVSCRVRMQVNAN